MFVCVECRTDALLGWVDSGGCVWDDLCVECGDRLVEDKVLFSEYV